MYSVLLRQKLKNELKKEKAAKQPILPAPQIQPSSKLLIKKTISRHWNDKVQKSNIWLDAGPLPNYERIRLQQKKMTADSLGSVTPSSKEYRVQRLLYRNS